MEKLRSKEEKIDPFNRLPEGLLLHILSCLKVKDAMKMSFQSSQWRNLWQYSNNIEFGIQTRRKYARFYNFVERVLELHKGTKIDKFQILLTCSAPPPLRVNSWIEYAISKRIKELNLGFSPNGFYQLPQCMFNIESLEVLKLSYCYAYPPSTINLRLLKTLSLTKVIIPSQTNGQSPPLNEIKDLISKCPLLENLELSDCNGITCLDISTSNPKLKSLRIVSCCYNGTTILEILAPNLTSLELIGSLPKDGYILRNLSSLVHARVDFDGMFMLRLNYFFCWETSNRRVLYDIFHAIRHAKTITLGRECMKVLSEAEEYFMASSFVNIKCLKLEISLDKLELRGIICFLKSCPNLETLIIQRDFEKISMHPQDVAKENEERLNLEPWDYCFASLKIVKIFGFMGRASFWACIATNKRVENLNGQSEMKLVKFLLKYAASLKEMLILQPCWHFSLSVADSSCSPWIYLARYTIPP
ncbi:putative F-box protein At1g49610 [Tasmannia lanceolata]|uniref:putative F-box protein At1g49610 n=1 Tax=Tasmannia lanceolata TaxID=3420 RepID=UPI004062EBF3